MRVIGILYFYVVFDVWSFFMMSGRVKLVCFFFYGVLGFDVYVIKGSFFNLKIKFMVLYVLNV